MNATVILVTLIMSILAVPASKAETLKVLDRRFHVLDGLKYCPTLTAVRLGGDTVIHGSVLGVYLQPEGNQSWMKLIDCLRPEDISRKRQCYSRRKLKQLVWPEGLWRIHETNEIVAFDGYCGWLYSLHLKGDFDSYVKLWSKRVEDDHFQTVNIQEAFILCGLPRYEGDTALVIQSVYESRYERVFAYPASLARRLDSVGVSTGDHFCYPALNPLDSSLWIAIYGYGFIYITDMKGHIQDSLPIEAPDFAVPPQIKSRIKSNAVAAEWLSQWTQIRSLRYVVPGYFLLQYDVGSEDIGGARVRLHSTLAWKANGEQIPLEVDKRWQLAGVEADGELIFVCYQSENEQSGIAVYMARIQP
ncbi:MAG: hypothetical protein KAW46_01555 [candidate division Zixibacteria bacterium]|nr:hypothetical protein [candidate division Zixibacteria bacterium]